MKKVSTRAAAPSRNILQPKLTVGLDLGDRNSWPVSHSSRLLA